MSTDETPEPLDSSLNQETTGPVTEPVEPTGAERRRDYRLSRVFGAELQHEGGELKARLFVINISSTGFRATCNQALPQVDKFDVKLRWDSKEAPFSSTVRVAWQRELTISGMFDLGFEFVHLEEADWQRLVGLIEREREKTEKGKKPLDLKSPWSGPGQ